MKNIGINNRSKLSLTSKVLFGALAIVVITGLGAVAYAADDMGNEIISLSGGQQIRLFNPFTLQSEPLAATPTVNSEKEQEDQEASVGSIFLFDVSNNARSPVRIPYRPELRSPYRPPLVP